MRTTKAQISAVDMRIAAIYPKVGIIRLFSNRISIAKIDVIMGVPKLQVL